MFLLAHCDGDSGAPVWTVSNDQNVLLAVAIATDALNGDVQPECVSELNSGIAVKIANDVLNWIVTHMEN